jgi:hypothetical protein
MVDSTLEEDQMVSLLNEKMARADTIKAERARQRKS